MVARVARFEGVNAEAAERTMGQAEEIIRPLVEGLAGYQGYLDLWGEDGTGLSIVFFDSMADAEAAEPTFDEEMPKALGDLMQTWGGRRVSVERFTVQADSRR